MWKSPVPRVRCVVARLVTVASFLAALVALVLTSGGAAGQEKLHPWTVPFSSMEPTLHCAKGTAPGCEGKVDDIALSRPLRSAEPKRSDTLVFRAPHKMLVECGASGVYIKRVIGLPGETVREKLVGGRGYIFIDGKKLEEPYVQAGRRDSQTATWHVPRRAYFLMGDNRAMSCDSRLWGSLPRGNIVGKVVAIQRGSKRINAP
jgi:signal peptidase I